MDASTLGPSIASAQDLRTLLRMRDGPVVSLYTPTNTLSQTLTDALHTLQRRNGCRDNAFSHIARRLRSERMDVHRSFAVEDRCAMSIAIFATAAQAVHVALPVPVPARVVFGEAPFLGPLLTLFHPSYVVGLYLNNRGAHALQRYGAWQAHRPLDVLPPAADTPARQSTMASKGSVFRWLQALDRRLDSLLACRHHPVVLIGPADLSEAYASVNVHRSVIAGGPLPAGACSDVNALLDVITAAAQDRARSHVHGDLRALWETRTKAPKRYVDDAQTILEEAAARRVDTLFVRRTQRVSRTSTAFAGASTGALAPGGNGVYEPAANVEIAPPHVDARIEAAMAHTIASGGTVHEATDVQIAAHAPMIAVLRY